MPATASNLRFNARRPRNDTIRLTRRNRMSFRPGPKEHRKRLHGSGQPLNKSCGACKTKASMRWWKPPRALDLTSPMLCDDCSMSWRKYADLKIGRTEDSAKAKSVAKREGSPLILPQSKRNKAWTVLGLRTVKISHVES